MGVDVHEFKQVPSWPRLAVNAVGQVRGASGRTLKDFPDKNGYRRVNLYQGDRRWRQFAVHALVCETFHGPRPEGAHVAHRDGNPGNNRAENVRWASPSENEADKVAHGTAPRGERNSQARLSDDAVREIRAARAAGVGRAELSDRYGVSVRTISAVSLREAWRHVP